MIYSPTLRDDESVEAEINEACSMGEIKEPYTISIRKSESAWKSMQGC